MVKNLQCLKIPQTCYLEHAEHHAKNRSSLQGLDHDTLFFWITLYFRKRMWQKKSPRAKGFWRHDDYYSFICDMVLQQSTCRSNGKYQFSTKAMMPTSSKKTDGETDARGALETVNRRDRETWRRWNKAETERQRGRKKEKHTERWVTE